MTKTEIARYLGKFGEQYEKIVKCRLYSNLDVIFEWWIPNTEMYHHEETKLEDIAIEIQVELAKMPFKIQTLNNYLRISKNY
ncbi:MAG: hypothetical protein HC874_01345 [Richelia sp. SL_2_1]|nr:hypothetical protein [Richelia sp. SL_2_1]